MAGIPLHSFLDHLRRLHGSADEQRSDRELLHAFIHHHDQDAFAAVLRRHAALVWGVCRRILGHQQDAEDVFQATFLILARRAGGVRWQSSVGGWLHTVAQRLAVRVRQREQLRRIRQSQAPRAPQAESSLQELAAVVDEQLRLLPEKYREPLLLHYLEGQTAEAAARQLGVCRSTFYNRLHRGREMLRVRLSRQGLPLAAPLLAATLMQDAEAAAPSLLQSAMRGAMGSVPERVAVLAAEAMPVTAMLKGKIALAMGLLLGVAAGGVAMLTPQTSVAPPQAERRGDPPKASEKSAVRRDRYGDPLPTGAVVRLGTVRFRAPGEVVSLAFAPDGKTVAVSAHNGELLLMDAENGKRKFRFTPVTDPNWGSWGTEQGIVFSPDGKQLISRGHKAVGHSLLPVVRVWDAAGKQKPKEYDIGQWLLWAGWSAEGQPLALRVEKGTLHLHELAAGRSRPFTCQEPQKNPVGAVSVSPRLACAAAGHALALADNNNVIHVWDIATGRERCTLQVPGDFVFSLTFSPDGRRLVCGTQKTVQMWDATTGKLLYTVPRTVNYLAPVFSPDGKTLAIGDTWSAVCFWDAETGREKSRTEGKSYFAPEVAFSPDGKYLATTDRHSSVVHFWDTATGRRKAEPEGHTNRPWGIAFTPDGRRVVSGGTMGGDFRLWDASTGEPLHRISHSGMTRSCAFSPDGRSLFASWSYGGLAFYDVASGDRRHVIEIEDPERPDTYQSIIRTILSRDGKTLTAFSYYYNKKQAGPRYQDTLITGWDASTHKQLFRRRRPGMEAWFALSPDSRILAVPHPARQRELGAGKGPMRLENVATGEQLLTFPVLKGQTWPLAFSPDGRLLASNNFDGSRSDKEGQSRNRMHLWETATAAEVLSLPGCDANHLVAFSPDCRLLALTAPGQEILVWDLRLGRERRRFQGFDADVTYLAFSPDGRRLVSGLTDSTLLIWDVEDTKNPPVQIGSADAAKVWNDLAGRDAARAFRARGLLAAAPEEALALLKKHLHPVKPADPQRLSRLLADLDSDEFAVREKAQAELEQLRELAEPALRKALANKPTLEVRRRALAVLDQLREPITRPESLRTRRAVAVLEDIGTAAARRLLEDLAKGAPEARLTREAKAALQRLGPQ